MTTTTEKLMTRDGMTFEGKIVTNDKGKPGHVVVESCHRCGGAGGWKGWPGFTCYRCGGACKEQPRFVPLYTEEQLLRLNVAQAKRDAKREAIRVAKVAERDRIIAENTAKFNTAYPEMSVLDKSENPVVQDILTKGRERGQLSEAQLGVLVRAIKQARAHAEAQATSQHVGQIGERITRKVTVQRLSSYTRKPFGSYRADARETVWITSMVDEQGNVLVTKTPTFRAETNESFTLTATVKAHDEFRGVKQTVLQRAVRKDDQNSALDKP
jgi:hypothetical protein